MKKEGHTLLFLGGGPTRYQNLQAFERTFEIPFGNSLEVTFSPFLKRNWIKTIDKINPDIIHAHNVHVAQYLLDTKYPVVYDDHEYWSRQVFKYKERKLPRGITSRPLIQMIPRWERQLLRKYPTLTTTENTAKEHSRHCSWVGVTRNVPTLKQIEGLDLDRERRGLVYVGNDFKRPRFLPHRNMKGLRRLIEFDVISGKTHREMMESIINYEIGLTPWLPHPWHPFSDANRNYEYLHAGLPVVVNSVIKSLFSTDPFVYCFTDYSDIVSVIEGIKLEDPARIANHAREKYVWEKQESIIKEAYQRAIG